MSISEYARTRGVHRQAVQHQIRIGVIVLVDGKIDPEQADASWGRVRNARITAQDDDDGKRSARAKIAMAVAKLRAAQERFQQSRDRYGDREEAVRVAAAEADYVLAALATMPARHAAAFAAALGIDSAVARDILDNFTALVIAELGDLRAQAIRAAEAA